jgi:hypothetical protein
MNIRSLSQLFVVPMLVVLAAQRAEAAPPSECSPLMENSENCTLTVWTYPHTQSSEEQKAKAAAVRTEDANTPATQQSAFSPLPVRVRPRSTVTLRILHRPLEKVTVSKTFNEQAKPDVIGTVFSQLAKSVAGLAVSVTTFGAKHAELATLSSLGVDTTTPPEKQSPEAKKLLQLIADYNDLVDNVHSLTKALGKIQGAVKDDNSILQDIIDEASAAQRFVPAVVETPAGTFQWTDRPQFEACIKHLQWRLGEPVEKPADNPCRQTPPPSGNTSRDKGVADLSSPAKLHQLQMQLDALPPAISSADNAYTALLARMNALDPQLAQSPLFDMEAVRRGISALVRGHAAMTAALKAAPDAPTPVSAYAQVLDAWPTQYFPGADPSAPVVETVTIRRHQSSSGFGGQQKVDTKVQSQALLVTAKDPVDAGTASVTFVEQRWEVSAGIMWSNVLGRTFQNTPQIKDGQPELDANGKQINLVTETTTKPTVDAIALVHYRIMEWRGVWNRRIALLASAGIGTGTNGSGPDFAAGGSIAFGNLMISPLLHFTRDVRLTNGVKVGDNLGPSPPPPPTERYWVHKLGIGLTYVVPLPGS